MDTIAERTLVAASSPRITYPASFAEVEATLKFAWVLVMQKESILADASSFEHNLCKKDTFEP